LPFPLSGSLARLPDARRALNYLPAFGICEQIVLNLQKYIISTLSGQSHQAARKGWKLDKF
jgi:hypothetical protein